MKPDRSFATLVNTDPLLRVPRYVGSWSALGFLGCTMLLIAALAATPAQASDCSLNAPRGRIKHVIYIQFDNVHFTRDNPNVPSDLEQMPNLLNFLTENGTLMANHHTPLKSHTADDIITSLTGVYGDRHGQPIANSFGWFTPPGSKFFDGFASSFQYWTDIVNTTTDPSFFMVTPNGMNAPAPWVPWTRAGCNVGAVSIANMELENVSGDIKTVFASDATKLAAALAEASSNKNEAVADYDGIAIHCAANDAVCSAANGGEPDVLSQEPGGYTGFSALYGHKFVAPVISPRGPLNDLDGNLITDDSTPANPGFPGFGGIDAAQTLSYVAAMQEQGVPVTYAYIADIHDNDSVENSHAPGVCFTDPDQGGLGPGDVCHDAQAAAYNEAFGKFFQRLAADGIDKSNTLFVITADEGDHFAGGPPSPSNCDGVTVPCTYSKIGEIDSNIQDLLAKEDPNTANTQIDIQFDMVPVFYLDGNPAVGSSLAREFERDAAALTAVSPITGKTEKLTAALADPVELKLLHMVTGDPQRTPTFVMFGNPNWFFELSGPDAVENPAFAWNHGGIQPEINTTFLGMVGPGVEHEGIDWQTWSDHTDIRPTMLLLTGLKDDYPSDGRALVEALNWRALPDAVRDSGENFQLLADAYKKINAPVGPLGLASLQLSTAALAGDDDEYNTIENGLSIVTSERNQLASQMIQRLEDAEFNGKPLDWWSTFSLVWQADGLLNLVQGAGRNVK